MNQNFKICRHGKKANENKRQLHEKIIKNVNRKVV